MSRDLRQKTSDAGRLLRQVCLWQGWGDTQMGAGGTGSAGLCSEAAGLRGTLLGQRCVAANAGRQETTGRHPGTALPSRSNAKRCD